MGLIKSYTEIEAPKTVKMMVYGQPGSGKSTLALSAPKPLILDFEDGVKRVNMNHLEKAGIVQVKSWNDAKALLSEDLRPFDSIIIDTVGKMIDMIIGSVCGTKQPRIQDWGRINTEAKNYIQSINRLGKNLILTAHRTERKYGEILQFVPDVRDNVYKAIISELDLLGYVEIRSNMGNLERTITFNPTDTSEGKNTCNLPGSMVVAQNIDNDGNPTKENNFILEEVIKPYQKMVQAKVDVAKAYEALLAQIRADLSEVKTVDQLNDFVANIDKYEHVGSSKIAVRGDVVAKATELKATFNPDTKKYE